MGNPLVSIIINNYNYGRFLRDAVESAINQTYRNVEVIVVDDGSTDNSREIIAEYTALEKVIPVLKENGGQASAFNAGYAVARGAWVLFLDADDVLLPEALEVAISALAEGGDEPYRYAKIQWRLALTDSALRPLGGVRPWEGWMPSGDLSRYMWRWGYTPTPPTSGNLFARWFLDKVLPVPEGEWRISADAYLFTLAPLYGWVLSLNRALGLYRVHGGNRWYTDVSGLRQEDLLHWLEREWVISKKRRELLTSQRDRFNVKAGFTWLYPYPSKVQVGLVVLKKKPFAERVRTGWAAACRNLLFPFVGIFHRIRLSLWLAMASSLPLPWAVRLVELGFNPQLRLHSVKRAIQKKK